MKRHSSSTTLIAVVIAGVLFVIANYFEDEDRWQLTEPDRPAMNPARDSSLGGPVKTIETAGRCEAAENAMLLAVENSRYCTTDDDCTLFDYGYPIQCMTSVSMSEITALRLQYRDYEASCRFRVYYDCPTEGAARLAVCRNNQCTVELETIDSLRDETLDYLGIE